MGTGSRRGRRGAVRAMGAVAVVLTMGGCLQTAPVVVTPQEQQSRVVYNCPNARTLDVTRIGNGASAIVVVDGTTLQLSRDTSTTSGERYTNRLQTLTLYGGSASFETLGRTKYGPCTAGEYGVPGGEGREGSRANKMENTD